MLLSETDNGVSMTSGRQVFEQVAHGSTGRAHFLFVLERKRSHITPTVWAHVGAGLYVALAASAHDEWRRDRVRLIRDLRRGMLPRRLDLHKWLGNYSGDSGGHVRYVPICRHKFFRGLSFYRKA